MKRLLRASIPFAAMLALALGSVVFSCATTTARRDGKPSFVNTDADGRGRFWTVQAFERVDRVMLIDLGDRSRRTELGLDEWSYDRASTELVLSRKPLYARTMLHVEGKLERPARFELRDVAEGEVPLVVVDGRLAILGFDYSMSESHSSIVFREDFDPEEMDYLIKYDTSFGISSIGNPKPGSMDAYAYLETQHFSEVFAKKGAESKADWFLDPSFFEGGKPRVVRREPTPEEKAAAAKIAIPVMKSRRDATDAAISKEVGFDARTPRKVAIGSGGKTYSSVGKFIEERAEGGRLHRSVFDSYSAGDTPFDGRDILMLSLGPDAPEAGGPKDERLMIEQRSFDAGLAVELERGWGITSNPSPSAGPGGKPEAVALALFHWEDRGVFFELSCDDGLRADAEALVRGIIAYRKKAPR